MLILLFNLLEPTSIEPSGQISAYKLHGILGLTACSCSLVLVHVLQQCLSPDQIVKGSLCCLLHRFASKSEL